MARRRGKSDKYPSILVIPDTQAKEGVPTSHLDAAGRYAVAKRPSIIVHLGDCADMPALSSYDSAASKGFDQRSFTSDIDAGRECARLLTEPMREWNRKHRTARHYRPELVMLEGNHDGEHGNGRIARAVQDAPWLRGALLGQLRYQDFGFRVVPFLQPIILHKISFAHFFCRNAKGQVVQSRRGMPSAMAQVVREGVSAISGHKQGLDSHIQPVGDGTRRRGIIAGSFYQHDESYMTEQGQDHWRGVLMLNEVREGDFDLVEASLGWLLRRWA